ncbi:hatching enzyme 1.2-like [Clarias gariepinus]|uniref:hatching enzyme 1.2-like n=1 Tax=Clarias gariepinus TaxID=13013 RepID=UPI00234D5430|nr:hatching enzyme 1.2-like [Clarias gariepinus]XP_053348112.1 hatching enzyme 1.2-like [Clarias gariepinus]XP_053348113.1 hatching enzyme 1.2-like [Clarias gariepinus]XP_053348114.1 hatching enzyme 1.2-like [Clarias gariepinus]XP_053348116.1 hatching enzyme 1.2-like [Clarias gariepinus]XP_053348117.1 hatching enzyme 1.2-like [Clarias gariepinus]XP_053349310.1 hatching enzyme 1.2-like [Clarias gariepinus]
MESRASLSILALLLGFSQAFYLNQSQDVDITTRILTTNKGSNEVLLEGDILLPRGRNALVCTTNDCFWKKSPNGLVEVPFTVSSDFSSSDLTIITSAMATFHSKTCIKFIPRTNETDYISIQNLNGCYSSVGKTGGAQVVSLSRFGCVYYGIVEHELNHALGFYHEHTRSDRDSYVQINWANIQSSMKSNFDLQNTNNLNTAYDYSSIMHYAKTAFSANGLDTITPIPNKAVNIGQRQELSTIDILRINKLYNC